MRPRGAAISPLMTSQSSLPASSTQFVLEVDDLIVCTESVVPAQPNARAVGGRRTNEASNHPEAV